MCTKVRWERGWWGFYPNYHGSKWWSITPESPSVMGLPNLALEEAKVSKKTLSRVDFPGAREPDATEDLACGYILASDFPQASAGDDIFCNC